MDFINILNLNIDGYFYLRQVLKSIFGEEFDEKKYIENLDVKKYTYIENPQKIIPFNIFKDKEGKEYCFYLSQDKNTSTFENKIRNDFKDEYKQEYDLIDLDLNNMNDFFLIDYKYYKYEKRED